MTNFEKLVELGKTDMSEFSKKIATRMSCGNCPICDFCKNFIGNCISVWQIWLESEVEE